MNSQALLKRYGVGFSVLYCILFIRLHNPIPFGGVGVLALHDSVYMKLIRSFVAFQQTSAVPHDPKYPDFQAGLFVVFALLFGLYVRLLLVLRQHRWTTITLRHILAGVVVFSLPLLALPYILSTDVHLYIAYGRLSALYGDNPVFTAPQAHPNDPFFGSVYPLYRGSPSVYGPVWLILAHALTMAAEAFGGAQWLYVLLYKLCALVFHLGSTALMWSILRRWRPQQQVWGTLLYAWSPLALMEFVGSAHNDGVMIFAMLLAVWLAQHNRWRLALVALVMATLVKWIAIVLLPLYGLMVISRLPTWRERLQVAVQLAAVALGTATICYIPFGYLHAAITAVLGMPAASMSANSLGALVLTAGEIWADVVGSNDYVRYVFQQQIANDFQWLSRVGFVAAWAWGSIATWRQPTLERWVQCSCVVVLVVLCVTPWFWPWYVTWPLAIVPLLDWKPLGRTIVAYSALSSLVYAQVYGVVGPLVLCVAGVVYLRRYLRQRHHAKRAVPVLIIEPNRRYRVRG